MIEERKFGFLKTLRVLLTDENLDTIINKKKYCTITIISYKKLSLGDEFKCKHKKITNIYLDKTGEEIFKNFKRSTQLEIKKTYKDDNFKVVMDDNNLEDTYELYKKFEYSQGRIPWKIDTFDNTMLFSVYYKDELISSIPCYKSFPYLQARAMFSKRNSDDNNLRRLVGNATRRLVYELCLYGKNNNYDFVGLGPVNVSTEQKKNVSQFKMFFGGRVEDEYTYCYKGKIFIFLDNILKARVYLKKIFKL